MREGRTLRLNIGGVEVFNSGDPAPDDAVMIVGDGERFDAFLAERELEPEPFRMRAFDAAQPRDRGIVRFHVPTAMFAEERDALLPIWRDAAVELAEAYGRTNLARHHVDAAIDFLAEELRIGLPQPEYATVSLGQAIYDALSDEAKAAVDALPDDLFTDSEGIDHSGRFLKSIRLVHEDRPELWSVLMFGADEEQSVTLNVQDFNVITLGRKQKLVIEHDLVREEDLDNS